MQLETAKKSRDLLEVEWFRYKASMAPIRKCPEEILLMVFEYYLSKNPRLVRRLLLVCRQWYQLAISAPRLWNRILIYVGEEWDVDNACKSIRMWVERCLTRSKPLLLDITLDFSVIGDPVTKIRSKIVKSLYEELNGDVIDLVNDWAATLHVDTLDDPDVISVYQFHHLFDLLNILVGHNGKNMSRWRSLELHLPDMGPVAMEITQRLTYPATSLNRLYWIDTSCLSNYIEGDYQYPLSTLRSLESLDVPDPLDLSFLDIQHSSVNNLKIRAQRCWSSVALNMFTQLQELEIIFEYAYPSLEAEFVTLPSLRRLILKGWLSNLGDAKFQVPVLDMLCISRGSINGPFSHPRVHAIRLTLEFDWHQYPYLRYAFDQLRSYLHAVLVQYQNTVHIHLPLHLKENALEILGELKAASILSSSLESPMATHSTSSDPPEIRKKLEVLQLQHELIEKLRSRISTAELECVRLETEILEYRASVAPIRRCPQELLLMFFKYYTYENPRLIRRLLLVCKQWYELAISSPRLWNRIPIEFNPEWDVESACDLIKKRLEKCIDLSGSLPLELSLDFGNFVSPEELIRSKIHGDLLDYIQIDEYDAFDAWADSLNVDLLNDPEVMSACQTHHLYELLRILIGEDGDIMAQWGTLRLDLPTDPELAVGIMELFSHATPSLVRLTINHIRDMRGDFVSLTGIIFPDLSALEHLEVSNGTDLQIFKLNPPSMQNLTFKDMKSCDASIFTPFTRLQQLDVHSWPDYPSEGYALSRGIVHLPELRRLSIRGPVIDFGTFEFHVPVLDKLHLSRSHVKASCIYPKVQSSRISWGLEDVWASNWTSDKIKLDIRAILLQYRSATELQLPSRLREMVLALLKELKSDDTWLSALRFINLEAEDGTVLETIEVQEI
ncbi:hypothetical protein M408DRAFT_19946 [Serendipita vermifera MAFF 305830]|uniref:F-box domain-containing protein n=1 Tax=Serendipita vermifera MAFF 305830 TaxID=933852 RepID=A0A0C3BM83_SERVB|nr:hypothetical protein M408DRAFT_19946 [Serendipita vermifera MAFF 305830]